METVIGPRKELGVRTIFNVLGPLTNPAGANAQVVGVYDQDLVPVLGKVLARLEVDRALVVHGQGIDEITIHGETSVAEVTGELIEEYVITPETLGLDPSGIEAVSGGTPAENAAALRGIITGSIAGRCVTLFSQMQVRQYMSPVSQRHYGQASIALAKQLIRAKLPLNSRICAVMDRTDSDNIWLWIAKRGVSERTSKAPPHRSRGTPHRYRTSGCGGH